MDLGDHDLRGHEPSGDHDLRGHEPSEVMNHLEMKLQRPDLNRHESPYEDAALPVEPLCIIRC